MKFYFHTKRIADWFYDEVMFNGAFGGYRGYISSHGSGWVIETRPIRTEDEKRRPWLKGVV